MNRHEWETQIYASNMNTTAKMVALAMGQHGSWVDDRPLQPGLSRVADMCSMTRDTVKDYVDALEEQGYLKNLGRGQFNTTKYAMQPVVADSIGILAKKKRKMNPASTASLKNLVADTTDNQLPIPAPVVADTTGLVADSIDTNIVQPIKDNIEEHRNTTDAEGDGTSEDVKLEEDTEVTTTSPNLPRSNMDVVVSADATTTTPNLPRFNRRDVFEGYLANSKWIQTSPENKEIMKDLMLNPEWQPHETRPNFRWSLAVEELKERGLL